MSLPTSNPSTSGLSIPFSLTTPPQSFRLLELPPEVLDIIAATSAADGRGVGAPLRLTSAPAVLLNGSGGEKQGLEPLHLCAGEKVWSVRQVSTSNSVFVTECADVPEHGARRRTTRTEDGDAGREEMDLDVETTSMADSDSGSARGITAVAQVGSVLELVPVETNLADVDDWVRRLVPVFHTTFTDGANGLRVGHAAQGITTTQQVKCDIPGPTNLIQQALDRLCVFETQGAAYVPSDATLLDAWKKIVEGCAIQGIRLDKPLKPQDVVDAASSEDEAEDEDMYGSGFPPTPSKSGESVYKTIARTLFTRTFPTLQISRTDTEPNLSTDQLVALHPQRTTTFLGRLLRSVADPVDAHDHGFKQQWRAVLPEAWWGLCDEAVLDTGRETEGSL